MKKSIYYLALLCFTTLFACARMQPVEVKQVESVQVLNLTENTADVAVDIRVDNPNKMKILVKDCNLDAYLNHKYVGKVLITKDITIHKKSEGVHTLLLKADMNQVKKLAPSMLFAGNALINLKGDLLVKAKGINKKIAINVDKKVSRKELRNFNLVSATN